MVLGASVMRVALSPFLLVMSSVLSLTSLTSRSHADAPRPYSIPWQLRPAAAVNVVRSDTAVALYEAPGTGSRGTTVATTLLVSGKITPELAPMLRVAWVHNTPPVGAAASALVNPLVGLTWAPVIGPEYKLGLFVACTAPIGQGGGDAPDKDKAAARASGIPARSAMDNALFSVNDLTPIGGAGFAWVAHGLTVQAEVTVLELLRVRGAAAQPDKAKTNFTSGLHVGYFVIPQLSIAGELRYQRWLTTPVAVEKDTTGTLRDTTTFAIGVRGHIPLGGKMWLRPGVAYARALDAPMSTAKYNIVQIDIPFLF